jgi:hypothetical protein
LHARSAMATFHTQLDKPAGDFHAALKTYPDVLAQCLTFS